MGGRGTSTQLFIEELLPLMIFSNAFSKATHQCVLFKYFLSCEALLSLVGILCNKYVLLTHVGIWYNKCVKSLLCTECCVMLREELRKNWSLHSKGSESSNRKRTWREDASTLVPFLSICISKEFGMTGSREREQNGEVS